jgi:putative DNA primase/helicase
MASSLLEVQQQMADVGIVLLARDLPLRADGRWHNAGKSGKAGYKIECVYANGTEFYTGVFGLHGKQWFGIRKDAEQVSIEREEWMRQQAEIRRAADAAKAKDIESAQGNARELWARASKTGRSPYLERKGIARVETARFDGNLLRIPMVRYDHAEGDRLKGIQTIKPDGSKLFTKGMAKAGASCKLGCVVAGEPLILAEGYATAATIREATGYQVPVFVCFDAGNLMPAAEAIRAVWRNPILICADDDWRTAGNPGRDKALRVTRALPDCHMTYPVWPLGMARDAKHTDFNDLAAACGLNVVARRLAAPLSFFREAAAA